MFEDEGHSGATLVRPGLERLRDLVAQVGVDVVLCYSPDRLARKFAYQALLIEEFARAGTRVEFVNGPARRQPRRPAAGAVPGHVRRVREGPADGALPARQGPPGPRRVGQRARRGPVRLPLPAQKRPRAGPPTRSSSTRRPLVAELFRRYTDDGASIADLTRWLTGQGVPTRTGKTRWDRSRWSGACCATPPTQARRSSARPWPSTNPPGSTAAPGWRAAPRRARPRPWTGPARSGPTIPVPAIVTAETFDRAAQRLADNKRFASRNSKVPSLLQGLAACSACGYGYYRTSTRTTNKKIYYYRCLGSDDYRYEGGRVCANKPVRADYLDTVVWDHITGLLADPHLIRAEIDKRLDARPHLRSRPPSQRKRLELRPGQGHHRDHPHDRGVSRNS